MAGNITKKQIEELIERDRKSFLADYKKIVESPSVSCESDHTKDCRETAEIAVEFLKTAGAKAKVVETKGHPGVFGHFENKPGAPTVAIYNHLDVQPAEKGKDGWTREPFKFVEENGRFYSRGTTDDKGPAMTALWAAKMAKEFKIPLNIEFLWELEEEIASPSFEEFISKTRNDIKANSILVSDTVWVARGKPAMTKSLRGALLTLVRLRTAAKDSHSGMAGGGARNPVAELADLISKSFDARTGDIKIEGFAETWTPPTKEDLDGFVAAGFDVEYFKKAFGLEKIRFEDPRETTKRIWASPTFEVHGISGGYHGEGVKTIVPPEAEAKISFRLVPGQDPDHIYELFKKHVARINPDCEVIKDGILRPYASPVDLPQRKAVVEALDFGFGVKPSLIAEGGSIGAVETMDRVLGLPILFMGLSLPEDSYHGPDESFAWEQLEGGVKAFVRYFELVAKA